MTQSYPHTKNEFETVAALQDGFSLARFGDGEFGMSKGGSYVREKANRTLADELMYILHKPNKCLIGIPTMNPKGAKFNNWYRHYERYRNLIPHNREYYSAFISRPDSAQWIDTVEYAEEVQKIWLNRKVHFVGPEKPKNKLGKVLQLTQEIDWTECPTHGAYEFIDELERSVRASDADLVILSHGVSATCLAYRLAPTVQTVDLGSIGSFLMKKLGGKNEKTD